MRIATGEEEETLPEHGEWQRTITAIKQSQGRPSDSPPDRR
jgi:hypothetical protein